MRILEWNIRWGGGERMSQVLSAIETHEPDIAILSEYKAGASGIALVQGLQRQGLINSVASISSRGKLGVLIASRHDLTRGEMEISSGLDSCHLLHAQTSGIDLLGVYLPWDDRKVPYWPPIHEFARTRQGADALLVGDFNTGCGPDDGEGEALRSALSLSQLTSFGFFDVWREANPGVREYSWGPSPIGSQRLDHIWASSAMRSRIPIVRFSHDERVAAVSDHSILLADISPDRLPT